jgi:O-antigen/teichoic acid export membrane protein
MPSNAGRTARFLHNVLWSWAGVLINIFTGFALSPFIIRRLGSDDFGVWTLVLSLVEYYWLLDFGFRNATVKYTAHYRAMDRSHDVNRVINTALMYAAIIGATMLLVTVFGGPFIAGHFKTNHAVFTSLLMVVGASWSMGVVFNVFGAALEGFQRYDVTSRIWIISGAVRSIGLAVVVALGLGLRYMALMLLASQVLAYLLNYLGFRRAFPPLQVTKRLADRAMLKEMVVFASQSFGIAMATRALVQTAPLMIGAMMPVRNVGYYSVPQKTLDYANDGVGRFGMVTGSNSAELAAKQDWDALPELGILANRYCLALYLYLAVFLLVYGRAFFSIWINPEFAAQSAPLLPVLLLGAVANSSQYNSSCILTGMGRQKLFAMGMVLEAVLGFGLIWLVIPRYGLLGVAAVVSLLMFLDRGIFVAWLLCRELKIDLGSFLARIYLTPLALGSVTYALLWATQKFLLPGRSWSQLIAAGAGGGVFYVLLAFYFILRPQHRAHAINLFLSYFPQLAGQRA